MKQTILFGGFYSGTGKGIYSMVLDTEKKTLDGLTLLAEVSAASYFASDKNEHLYLGYSENGRGGIAGFDLINMSMINSVTGSGMDVLCHLCMDEERSLVYGANYSQGIINVYRRSSDGSLVTVHTLEHKGGGPRVQQDRAHVHYTGLTLDKRLVVCDLGTDGVYIYDVDNYGKLSFVSVYEADKGSGCRHLVFHPLLSVAYVLNELSSTVDELEYKSDTGEFIRHGNVSMLPDDYTGFNGAAAIRVSADGRFLYASNRGHDSIVSYSISSDGLSLTNIGWTSTYGSFPRDFILSGDGGFLICANEHSNNVVLFERDIHTGTLNALKTDIWVPECAAVYGL